MTRSATAVSSATMTRRFFQTLGPLAALLSVILLFAVLDHFWGGGQFATLRNARTVTIQSCTVAMAALGMTLIIIAGGIDLSCGTAIALAATVLAWGLREDIGCLLQYGDNYSSAVKRLHEAERRLNHPDAKDPESLLVQKTRRRERLIQIVEAKLARLAPTDDTHQLLSKNLLQLEPPRELGSFRALDAVPNEPSTIWWSLAAGLFTGVACGFVNGALISFLRVVPFIVTLGTMTIYLGIGNWLSNNVPVRPSLKYQIPPWLQGVLSNRGEDFIFGFPLGVWLAALAGIVLAIVLRYTVFGRYIFALGSNEQTARLCGINVSANKIAVYTLSGLLLGLAGVLQFSRLSSGNPMSGQGLELQIIAAVVIGGGSLSGGRGSILGTLAGAGIMAVIVSGGTQLGMSNALQHIILGVVIISAVTIDQLRQRMGG